MKRNIVAIVLASTMILSITACGNGNQNASSENESSVSDIQIETNDSNDESGMSQSEWMEENSGEYQDGYEVVDEINIDTSEISLKYTGNEIVDYQEYDGTTKKMLIVYCDFTNKTPNAMNATGSFMTQAFQGGIENTCYGGSDHNEMVDIMDGATINVGFMVEIRDTETPVKFRISQSFSYEGTEVFAQQQEIALK